MHPKQRLIISIIVSSAIRAGVIGKYSPLNANLVIVYKALHKNGKYKSILRQTGVFETNKNGRMISSYSILTDVTGLMNTEKVSWKLEGVDSDIEKSISNQIHKQGKTIFSTKELEVLYELKKGKTSIEIASKFNNSRHTIDTHRRKLLKKSHCKNTQELLGFAESLTI